MFKHGFPSHWSTIRKLMWLKRASGGGGGGLVTLTGAIVSFIAKAVKPIQELIVNLEPVQSGSGDPSPTNVRPITGWTGVEVNATGKNLVDKSKIVVGKWLNVNTGAEESTTTNYALTDYISVKSGQAYYFTNPQSGRRWFYDVNKVPVSVVNSDPYTPTQDGYVRFTISLISASVDDFQVELGSTASDYEPFQGTTLSVTFPDTVYGGKYDFVSGNLKPYKEYDSYNGETLTGRWMSSMDKYVAGTTPTIGAQVVDLDGFDTTVQLTPQQISTLQDVNNVWSNAGDITLTAQGIEPIE